MLAVVVVLLTPITSAGVMLAAFLFLPLPAELPERVPPSPSQISRVYDAAGNEIGPSRGLVPRFAERRAAAAAAMAARTRK